jgi:putative SOS response-associated peptidase YedK
MTQITDPAEVARIFDAEVRLDASATELRPATAEAGAPATSARVGLDSTVADDRPAASPEAGPASATPATAATKPRYNVAPTSPLTIVRQRADEGRTVEQVRWGLIPSFARDTKGAARMINARAETVATSPAFRTSFRARRCIVPSDGFYEWRRTGGPKQPYFLHPPAGALLALAGLWAVWKDPATDLWILSAAVITTDANRAMSAIHDRMPVLLPREAWDDWLDPALDDQEYLRSLLVPAPDDVLGIRPVSTRVNDVRNDGPELLLPIEEVEALPLPMRES